ncbi:MAG: hypothetical protein GWM89_09130 [Candidatus Dadabacteria bacterium]|nr:hypothetical protein [Candidatus Dadabacteria bacterium]NIX15839.1 hypothetical protein [Candidatus Dadabacteria bacterium]NIY22564.1 hypothetical protein [Candidatus Dadabacteria bacterium]
MYICSQCYYSGSPSEGENSSQGGLSGLIGSIFGSGNKTLTCPVCEKKAMIFLNTDQGKEIMDSVTK